MSRTRGRASGRVLGLVAGLGLVGVLGGVLGGCAAAPPPPAQATQRTTPPPWPAPADAVSYIAAAGLPTYPVGTPVGTTTTSTLQVYVGGAPVVVPGSVGIDLTRAVSAPLHTHLAGGEVWVEDPGHGTYTLGEFFTLWGVRFGNGCLGDACASLSVTVDGTPVAGDPRAVVWRPGARIRVDARR